MAFVARPINSTALRSQVESTANANVAQAQVLAEVPVPDPLSIFQNGKFRATTVSLGKDVRVATKPVLSPPTIISGRIELDGLNNPYVTLIFQIDRQSVDGGSILSFKVYRKKTRIIDLLSKVVKYNKADFDAVAAGTTRSGKFSGDRKGQYTLDPAFQDQVSLNPNLYDVQQTVNSQNLGSAESMQSFFAIKGETLDANFMFLADVNYAKFDAAQRLRQVYSTDDKIITVEFSDHKVMYGAGYAYVITSYSITGEESSYSPSVTANVINLDGIEPPDGLTAKQIDERTIIVSCTTRTKDNVKNIFLYKRESDEVVFRSLGAFENINDSFKFIDDDVSYLKTYTYRVIFQNMFGAISEPGEVTITSSAQRVIEKSRSHNMAIPILIASQDQNSDGIRLTVFPNDSKVSYYKIERRNITTGEKAFGVPYANRREFWTSNIFFVQKNTRALAAALSASSLANNSLPAEANFIRFSDPIVFVDNYVIPDNFYEYRTVGFDLFGNKTSYAFSSFLASTKNKLRVPINVKAEILRQTPFRIRVSWDDDNQAQMTEDAREAAQRYLETTLRAAQLNDKQVAYLENVLTSPDFKANTDLNKALKDFNLRKEQIAALGDQLIKLEKINNEVKFYIQRRMIGETVYRSFPLTVNKYVIDEVQTTDAIPFHDTKFEDVFTYLSSSIPSGRDSMRPFSIPPFLLDQKKYEYRIAAAINNGKETSDYSLPITVTVQSEMSSPRGFNATVVNPGFTPAVVYLSWVLDPLKSKPDHFRIERKVNIPTDQFVVIGNSYLDLEHFDRSVQPGNRYVYRIRSVSATGVESITTEIGISV
jgi:hypothetical protein